MKKSIIPVIGLTVMLIVSIVACVLIYKTGVDKQNKLNETIAQQNMTIEEQNAAIESMSKTQTVYRLTRDVKSGTVLQSDDIEQIQVGINFTQGYNTELTDLIGMTAIADYAQGSVMMKTMVYPEELRSDFRTLDILCDRQPIGFQKGNTVDVRITFPNGQDFLLLSKKLVNDVYGNAVQIIVDEKDILIYKSAEADWARFYKNGEAGTSVQIYCTTYVAAGAQNGTSAYYPIQTVLPDGETFEGSTYWVALNNYNLTDADLSNWLEVDRIEFEESLGAYDYYKNVKYTWNATYTYKEHVLGTDKDRMVTKTGSFICPDEKNAIKTEVARLFGQHTINLVAENNNSGSKEEYITLVKTNPIYYRDLETGSEMVNSAKFLRDNMYIEARNAYSERRLAMMEYREKEKAAYMERYDQGLVTEPWNDAMFDEAQWEQDFASGVLDSLKEKEEAEKEAEENAPIVIQ